MTEKLLIKLVHWPALQNPHFLNFCLLLIVQVAHIETEKLLIKLVHACFAKPTFLKFLSSFDCAGGPH